MKLARKVFVGIILTGVLFFLCNMFYSKFMWEEDRRKLDSKLLLDEMKQACYSSDLLYFAESSNATFAPSDSLHSSISQLVNDCFPKMKIHAIEQGALHAGVFRNLIHYIPADSKIKGIVVTMNLRSFGTVWINSMHENFCQRVIIANNEYPPLYNKMRIVFKIYDYKEDWERQEDMRRDFKNMKLSAPFPLLFKTVRDWDGYLFHRTIGRHDQNQAELSCHYVKAFAFNIDTLSNPRIHDFDEIIDICKAKEIKLYFNIMAENIQYSDSLVGKELGMMMKLNKNILMDRYSKKGVRIIDNLTLLDGSDYIEQNCVSEHYNQRGRQKIAFNVAKELGKDFSGYCSNCP